MRYAGPNKLFWVEGALRHTRYALEENRVGEVEREALQCAERALLFVIETTKLRESVEKELAIENDVAGDTK